MRKVHYRKLILKKLSHEEGLQQQVDLEEVELGHEEGSQQQVDLEENELSQEEGSQHQFGLEEAVESSEGNSSQPHAVCYVPAVGQIPVPISSHHCTYCDIIRNNDSATHFYTGLPTWGLFEFLLSHLTVHYDPFNSAHLKITPANGLLMLFMRLRLNALLEDLSYRFGIGVTTVCTVIQKWIDIMHIQLQFLITWPSQEVARANMPRIFRDLYPCARCIIDCSEIFIERPTAYQARAQTYSNYKKHNTVKFLIGISPYGAITFLSKC